MLASVDWLNGECSSHDVPDALAPNTLKTNPTAFLVEPYGPQRPPSFSSEGREIGLVGVGQTVPVAFKTPRIDQSSMIYGPLQVPLRPQLEHYEDDGTLRYDDAGFAFYVDPPIDSFDVEQSPRGDGSLPGGPDPQPTGINVPFYHSNPQFTKKIYLDFDGQLVSGTLWNGLYTFGKDIAAPVFSTDSDLTAYNASELATIQEVWARVSEDYAPYQVDVTTEDPGVAAFTAGGQAIRALISTNIDAITGTQWYQNVGGVAYLGSWDWTDKSPVWIFYNNLGNGFAKYVAEAVSHEVGHSLNLTHDGRSSPSEDYYAGHGSGDTGWAPIMGVGYYKSLTQWSKGEYTNANNNQDDLAIINGKLAYIVDDHGNNASTATQVTVGTTGTIATSGLIATRTDVDAFRFPTQAGSVTINVDPFDLATGKANLDVQLTLLNAAGTVLSTINGADVLNASLTTTLAKGFYTLLVDGVGRNAIAGDEGYSDYSSLGKYTVTGTVVPNQAPVAQADLINFGVNQSKLIDVMSNDSDPNLDLFSLLSVGAPAFGTVAIETGKIRYTPPVGYTGTVTFPYTIIDELGATGTTAVTVNVVPNSPPVLTADQGAVFGNEGTTITNTGTWSDSDIPANNVALVSSIGTVTKNSNGTWSWQITPGDQSPLITVTIGADDGMGGVSSTNFTYQANNLAPILTRSLASVSGNVLTTLTNSGTWNDVIGDNVVLSASNGVINKNANGTWNWSFVPSSALNGQSVTITATDKDNSSSIVTFSLTAFVAVTNAKVYYKDSSFAATSVDNALDTLKSIAVAGNSPITLGFDNLINSSRGINGLVFDVAGLVGSSLTTADFGFRVSPLGAFDESLNPPSTWSANVPAPTAILITPGTATTAARVRLEWADNAIANQWLQVRLLANANTGLLAPKVYYVGHLLGETTGINANGLYQIQIADITTIRPAVGQLAIASSIEDITKNGLIQINDITTIRPSVGILQLRNITIPAKDSNAEGERSDRSNDVSKQTSLQRASYVDDFFSLFGT